MLTNTERQQIVEEVNAGTYGIDEALDDIAAAQKGEEVRKALYAEALVLNREGHAGSTDMIARQQIANLQTSVNGQISTLRTEVGEDIDDLETALNSGLATQNGKIAAQNASIANVVANYNVEYGSTELWASTGETGALAAGTTVTLSEDVSHFDYIDIYSFCGNSNVLDTVPVDAKLQSSQGYALRWVNLSDPGSGSYKAYVRIIETRLHIIGTTLTIDHQVTYRNGEEVNISGAEITQANRSTYVGELGIMKVVGRKITANTEVTDIRVGADGTTYNSAGAAVRAQVTALESEIPAVDSTLSTQGEAADAKVVGGRVDELKSALDSKVDLTGENQVTPQNIAGMQFTKTTEEVEGENIFTSDMLFEEGYYVAVNPQTGNVTHTSSSWYNAYCIPVEQNTKYRFTTSRFVVLATGNTLGSPAIGTMQAYSSEIETGEATYLFLSIDNNVISSISDIYVKPVTVDVVYSDFVLPDWLQPDVDLSEIESRLESVESGKVDKDGTGQIKPQNIEGVTVSGGNILNDAERLYNTQRSASTTDGYVTIDNNTAIIQAFGDYCSFLIPVKPNTHYTANNSIRFAVLLKNLSSEGTSPVRYSTVVGLSALENIISFDTGEADHIIVSWNYNRYPINSFIISEGNTPTTDQTITLPDWLSGGSTPSAVEKPKFAVITGNIASGGNLQLTAPKNNLRKGERIVFEGNISSFDSLRIGLSFSTVVGTDSNQKNTFRIDGTNISYYAWSNSSPVTVAHGLTLANNIQIIWEMSAEASVKFTLISNGNMFTNVFTNYVRQTVGNPFVLSVGTVLTDCKLTWTCNDIDRNIWMFGDSYFAYSANRWTYYLHQYGYDQNCLLDGFPGEGGVNGRVAFNNLLQYGTPKFAVWCLGMNDNSDSDSAPSANWVSARNLFLQYCTNNGITPVFGTIPTVPTINHEQKNAWIRNSGYRYIDFAKAVGANANGVWYGNMLSSDNVHPSETGAKALFAQVLIDLPEIMVGGYGTPTNA